MGKSQPISWLQKTWEELRDELAHHPLSGVPVKVDNTPSLTPKLEMRSGWQFERLVNDGTNTLLVKTNLTIERVSHPNHELTHLLIDTKV